MTAKEEKIKEIVELIEEFNEYEVNFIYNITRNVKVFTSKLIPKS